VVVDSLLGKGECLGIWTVEDMRYLLMGGIAKGTVAMVLVSPVAELTSHTDTAGRKLPSPALQTRRKPVDCLGTGSPIHGVKGRDWSVVMRCPVALDPGHEQGVIAGLCKKRRLLEARQVDDPGFMEEIGEVQGSRIRPPALTSKEILCHSVNHIIHPCPPIKGLNPLLSLMAANPPPVDINGECFNLVMNYRKIVKARLGDRQARGFGGFLQGRFSIKGNS